MDGKGSACVRVSAHEQAHDNVCVMTQPAVYDWTRDALVGLAVASLSGLEKGMCACVRACCDRQGRATVERAMHFALGEQHRMPEHIRHADVMCMGACLDPKAVQHPAPPVSTARHMLCLKCMRCTAHPALAWQGKRNACRLAPNAPGRGHLREAARTN